MKKRKIIFSVFAILLIVTVSVLPVFGDYMGESENADWQLADAEVIYGKWNLYVSPTEDVRYDWYNEPDSTTQSAIYTLGIYTTNAFNMPSRFYEGDYLEIYVDTVTVHYSVMIYRNKIELYDLDSDYLEETITGTGKMLLLPILVSEYGETSWDSIMTWSSYEGGNPLYCPFYLFNNQQFNAMNDNYEQFLFQNHESYMSGLEDGYDEGYGAGYYVGQTDSSDALEAGKQLIYTVVETPVNVFQRLFNFTILGVNVFYFVTAILTIMLVAVILKRLIL